MSLLDTFPELATASRSPHVALTASPSLIEAAPGALGFGGTSSSSSRVVASPLPRDAAAPLQRDVAVVPHRGAGRPAGACGWVQDLKRLNANNPDETLQEHLPLDTEAFWNEEPRDNALELAPLQ